MRLVFCLKHSLKAAESLGPHIAFRQFADLAQVFIFFAQIQTD